MTYHEGEPCYSFDAVQEITGNCNKTDKKADYGLVVFNSYAPYVDWAEGDIGIDYKNFVAPHEVMHLLGYSHISCLPPGAYSLHAIQPYAHAACIWPTAITSHDDSDIKSDYD